MLIAFGIFFFLLGCAIGSFLNVVILRFNTGMGFGGRSQCFSCGRELQWYDLIPVFSYIFLGGKCSGCKSKISWQYPAVELLTGILFVGIFLKYSSLLIFSYTTFAIAFLYAALIFSILVVILVYDMRHKIIPDALVYTAGAIAFLHLFFSVPGLFTRGTPLDFLAGFILAAPFALLWIVSNGTWMGLGDAKLALVIGWMLGLKNGTSALILSFWIGAIVSVAIIVMQKMRLSFGSTQLTMKSEIPFAPFLILGLSIVFFFGISIIDISLRGFTF